MSRTKRRRCTRRLTPIRRSNAGPADSVPGGSPRIEGTQPGIPDFIYFFRVQQEMFRYLGERQIEGLANLDAHYNAAISTLEALQVPNVAE
jgi:hypothetical protein